MQISCVRACEPVCLRNRLTFAIFLRWNRAVLASVLSADQIYYQCQRPHLLHIKCLWFKVRFVLFCCLPSLSEYHEPSFTHMFLKNAMLYCSWNKLVTSNIIITFNLMHDNDAVMETGGKKHSCSLSFNVWFVIIRGKSPGIQTSQKWDIKKKSFISIYRRHV